MIVEEMTFHLFIHATTYTAHKEETRLQDYLQLLKRLLQNNIPQHNQKRTMELVPSSPKYVMEPTSIRKHFDRDRWQLTISSHLL